MSRYTSDDNRSMQLNPENDRYWSSRGYHDDDDDDGYEESSFDLEAFNKRREIENINLKKRFDVGCSCFIQYFKGEVSGWFWTCNFLTYDWVEKVKDLPTLNSNYSGGTYVIKKVAPRNAGYQLYAYCIQKVMSRTDYGYAYVDKWNKAPIRVNFNCGATYVDKLL